MLRLFILIVFLTFNAPSFAERSEMDVKTNTLKVAIVDIAAVLDQSKAMDGIKKDIDSISHDIQTILSTKESELKKYEKELLQKRNSLTDEQFELELSAFNEKVSQTQKYMQLKKNKLENSHAEAVTTVQTEIIKIISLIAEEQNIDLVLPNSHILFASNSLNITFEVIERLNKNLTNVNIKYTD